MNKGFQVGWWLIVITVGVIFAVSYFGINLEGQYLPSIIVESGVLIPILIGIIYGKKHNNSVRDMLGIEKFSIRILPVALLLTLGAQYFITYITLPVQSLLVVMFGADTQTSQMLAPKSIVEFIQAFVVLCVIAPLIEEFLCRGVLIKLFERYGAGVAIISSSLAFTLLHFEARSFFQMFFVGALFGVFRLYTGSVFVTIIMHSFNNLLSLLQIILMEHSHFSVLTIVILIFAFLFPVILYLAFTKGRKHFGYVNMTREKTGFSVGALICAVMFFGYNFFVFFIRFVNGDCLRDLYNLIGW